MKHYKAVIYGGTLPLDTPIIIEQDRVSFGATFMHTAIQTAFYEVCRDGIDAERIPYFIRFYADNDMFATLWFIVQHDGSAIFSDLWLETTQKEIFLRHMIIAE